MEFQELVPATPADGWVSVTIHDQLDPCTSYGYAPATFDAYCNDSGDKWLLACLTLIGGITKIDDDFGIIATFNRWQAEPASWKSYQAVQPPSTGIFAPVT